jgi:hypothetical protein
MTVMQLRQGLWIACQSLRLQPAAPAPLQLEGSKVQAQFKSTTT